MDPELTEAEVEALEKLNAQVQNIIETIRIQAAYQAEQSDLMKNMMRGMLQDVRTLKQHPDDAVECLTPSSEPSQGRRITVRPDSVTENVAAFVEDCYNTADEKFIVSSSTKPNLIFKDEMKIVSAVDAKDSDDIDSEVDKYSDSMLAKLTGFGIVHKEIFSIDSSSSLVLQKHESKDENVESGVGTSVCALNDSLNVCPPSVRQNAHEMIFYSLSFGKPPPLPPEVTRHFVICHSGLAHVGNDISISEEKAYRQLFEVLSDPNILDGLDNYSHLLVLHINGKVVQERLLCSSFTGDSDTYIVKVSFSIQGWDEYRALMIKIIVERDDVVMEKYLEGAEPDEETTQKFLYFNGVDGNYVFDKRKVHKYNKKNDIDVPMFDGNDLENWLFQLNLYFECYLVSIEQKLAIACLHMTGLAMTWYRCMFRHGKLVSWSSFISAVRLRFGPSSFEDLHDQLSKLSQIGTVSEIVTAFESLADQVLDVQEPILINMFISGLKAEIKRELLMARPRSLFFAFELARAQEAKFKNLGGLPKVSSMRPNYSNSSVVSSTIPFQSNSSVVPFTTSNKDPLKNVHRSMSPVKVDKSIDDAQVSSDLASSDKSYMYGKLPTKVFLVDFSLDLGLQNIEVVKEIDGYKFVVPACVRSRSINFCPHGVCQKIHETSRLHSEMLGELNEGYDILHGSEELLVIWLHKPPPLPPENVLKTERYFEERKFSDLVSSLKDDLYPEEVRTRKPKLLAASINLCAKEADMMSKDVIVELLRTLFLQDNLVKVTISESELLITYQFNVLYKPLGESIVESSRKLSKTSFVETALGSLPFSSCHGEIDDNDIGSNNKMLIGGATARGVIESVVLVFLENIPEGLILWQLKASTKIIWKWTFEVTYKFVLEAEITMKRLPTLAESMEKMIYITELCENGSGSLWDQSKPIHVLKLSLDRLKGLVMLAFETAFFILGFILVDPAFQVCCINKFYIFSSPRPPEVADLEDKVNFKDGGMLRNGISRNLRELLVFWFSLRCITLSCEL